MQLIDTSGVGRPDAWLWWSNAFELDRQQRPLLVMLAGRGDTPQHVRSNTYTAMANIPNDLDAFVLGITAKTSSSGGNSWNVSAEGCWPPADGAGPDDEGYIAAKIQQVIDRGFPIDPTRIWIWGHSCGGMMAFRYACDHPSQIAAAFQMSTFGIRTDIDAACAAGHFSYLHYHGTGGGESILYDNNVSAVLAPNTTEYVSVETDRTTPTRTSTITQVLTQNGCASTRVTTAGYLDFDSGVVGNEVDRIVIDSCPADGAVEIWKGVGSPHQPTMTTAGYNAMLDWFRTHTKP